MEFNKLLLTGAFCLLSLCARSQANPPGTLKGNITDDHQIPVQDATIRLLPIKIAQATDREGGYFFENLKPGKYNLEIIVVGYRKQNKEIIIKAGDTHIYNLVLDKTTEKLEEVSILGITKSKEIGKQAYNVTSIDAKPLHNTTMDLGQVINRVSGARIRESGGIGSDLRFSLNGFTGRQVRFFLDGVPMDNFGSSFQLNNIPVNFADRIEVYKGVVPVWLGGDALGGAVNIISNSKPRTYLDASYSYGSFNTHKSAVNAGYTAKSGFTVQLNAFQNYSDNNYWVDVDVVDQVTGLNNPSRVKRFHDHYHNETLVANIGVTGKKYADQLLFGLTLGKNRADIQTGNRMYDVYGARWRSGNIVQPSFKYSKKNLLLSGLDLNVSGNFNFGEERTVDTANKRYTWDGSFVYKNKVNPSAPGGEVSLRDYKFKNNNGIASVGLNYQINEKHSVSLNELYTTFNREGQNSFDPENIYDKQPRVTRKNMLGLGYKYDISEKFNTTAFVKQYNQNIISNLVTATYDAIAATYNYSIADRTSNLSKTGYGLAATYFLAADLQIKTSYERAYRLPDNNELFGDEINETSNIALKPENSHNLNLGATYSFNLNKVHYLDISANYIFRNANDYIRGILVPGGTSNSNGEYIQMNVNEAKVTNRGIDVEIQYAYKKRFSITANATYQNLRNGTQFETLANGTRSAVQSVVYRDRIPNTPYLFGNANGTLYMNHIFKPKDRFSISYNAGYVNQFYLFWPSQGAKDGKLIIPTQWIHDASLLYTVANGKYNIAFECLDLTDARLFDNYMLQKPSRAFNIKLRYFISKQTQ
ncbi:TonB-dependent receptor [Pedobacter petrophilus]|uniref:TonB-dependent receptor n=1 Tax=Pedobacter petrophilus TaxID=1908241 RepID=A0A7K0FVC3_9SPHI|nr:TonB-dependent receptor [Pedobacter petrophilus]MRX75024.1 TonB-dependent receptor [Pedobacter petrophilus]